MSLLKKPMKKGISSLNKLADKGIPDAVDRNINLAIVYIFEKKYDLAGQASGLVLDELIDLKKIKPEYERNMFVTLGMFLAQLLKSESAN